MAGKTLSSSVKLVRAITLAPVPSALTWRVAAIPSSRGITRSIRMTSGASWRAISTAAMPIPGLADHVDILVQFQEGAQTLADDLVIVNDQDLDFSVWHHVSLLGAVEGALARFYCASTVFFKTDAGSRTRRGDHLQGPADLSGPLAHAG